MSAITLLMVTLSSASAAAYERFPMDAGNLWIFDAPEGHRVIHVEESEALSGGWYASDAAGLLGGEVTLYDSDTSEEVVVAEGMSWGALFDFSAADGDSWSFALDSCDRYTVTAATDTAGSVMTPAGLFSDLAGFQLEHDPTASGCDDAPLSRIRFADGLGPVSFEDASGQRGRLLYASVGGEVAAASSHTTEVTGDLALTLIVNDDELASGAATVVVLVKNVGESALTVERPAGTRFVIDIFDRLTDEPLGTDTIGSGAADSLSLQPGGIEVLSATVDVSEWSGELTLRATMQASTVTLSAPEVDVER